MSNIVVTWMTPATIEAAYTLLGEPAEKMEYIERCGPASAFGRYNGERGVLYCVAMMDEYVVGAAKYLILSSNRRIDVERVAVAEYWRRQRIGTSLLDHIAGKLTVLRPTLWLSVPEDNLPALLWLRAYGGWDPPMLGHGGEGEPDVVWFKHSIKAREEVAA